MKFSAAWLRECLDLPATKTNAQLAERLTQLGLEVDEFESDEVDREDDLITIKTPANRGDCLCIRGIARDLAAGLGIEVKRPWGDLKEAKEKLGSKELKGHVETSALQACPYYSLAWISGIDPKKKAEPWILERLRKSGLRSVNAVVDILNYVMLELGQPMHAFDKKKIKGDLKVRYAGPKESIQLLDGTNQTLFEKETLVIADEKGLQAIAGVMGSLGSAVDENTTEILLESAYFDPINIRAAGQKYHKRTDASQRFERGVDPAGVVQGLQRALELIQKQTGGKCQALIALINEKKWSALIEPRKVEFVLEKIPAVLGYSVNKATLKDLFDKLGFKITAEADTKWDIKLPIHRSDLDGSIDLVEEVARMQGLDKIPSYSPALPLIVPKESVRKVRQNRSLKTVLTGRGYQEIISYSFIDPGWFKYCHEGFSEKKYHDELRLPLHLSNPIASDLAVMRCSIIPSLLLTLSHHQRYHTTPAAFFEQGICYWGKNPEEQIPHLSGVIEGQAWQNHWGFSGKESHRDFFSLKSDLDILLKTAFGPTLEFRYQGIEEVGNKLISQSHHLPLFHPHESAFIFVKDTQEPVGMLGALNPRLKKYSPLNIDLTGSIFVFELNLNKIPPFRSPVKFEVFSRYPSIKRDFAILVNASISAEQILNLIEKGLEATLSGSDDKLKVQKNIFDLYQGKGIPEGQKSLGITLQFQHQDHTLREEEIDQLIRQILALLSEKYGAKLR